MRERCIQIDYALDEVARACEFVSEEAHHAGLNDGEAHRCYLAVDEACTNIIEHGARAVSTGDGIIEICCQQGDDRLVITVSDNNFAFDPLSVPEPNPQAPIADRREGGWGVYFIRKLMDEVRYSFRDGYNHLVMVKNAAHVPAATPIHESPNAHDAPCLSVAHGNNGIIVVSSIGIYDARCGAVTTQEIAHLLDSGHKQIVLDMSHVTHMSTGGVKLLVNLWQRVRERRGRLVLAGVPSLLYELFELSGLDLIFITAPTIEQAEQLIRKRP